MLEESDISLTFDKKSIFQFAGTLYMLMAKLQEMRDDVPDPSEVEYVLDTLNGMVNVFVRSSMGTEEIQKEFFDYVHKEFDIVLLKDEDGDDNAQPTLMQ